MHGWSRWQCHGRSGLYLKGSVKPGKDLSRGVTWPDFSFIKVFRLGRVDGMEGRKA